MASLKQPDLTTDKDCYAQEMLSRQKEIEANKLSSKQDFSDRQLEMLTNTIEAEIIPRLMLAHRTSADIFPEIQDVNWTPTAKNIRDFGLVLITQDVAQGEGYVEELVKSGVPLELVFLKLFTATAKLLGEYWEEDERDFSEVTIGLSKLQQLLRKFAAPFESNLTVIDPRRRALVLVTPGDQHTFGSFMVEEFFRRSGWYVPFSHEYDVDNPAEMVRDIWFGVAGFSLSTKTLFHVLKQHIQHIRQISKNPNIEIMVGGALFVENPELVEEVGADATATDALQAVKYAEDALRS